MILNLKQKLKNLAGEELKGGDGKPVEIGRVMANAVISIQKTSEPAKNYDFSTKLFNDKEIDLSAEDLIYLKKQMKEAGSEQMPFPTLYRGQILQILEGLDKEEVKKKK